MTTKQFTREELEQDIILVLIVLISILITTLIDSIQCLISRNSKPVTPKQAQSVTLSKATTGTKSSKVKTQPSSPSTKRRSTTAVQRKVAGGTKAVTHNSATASSPSGKQSKPSSTSRKNTKSRSSQALGFQPPTTTTKSTSPTQLPEGTQLNVLTTADN